MKGCAAILVRVSSDVQDFSRQVSEMKQLAISDGYTVRDEHVFAEKISGYSQVKHRLELTRLMNNIRDNKTEIKIIYASELSRIARDPIIAREIVDEASSLKIPFFIKGIGRTIDENGERDSATNIVIQIYAEYFHKEATTAKARFKSGKRHEALKGKWAGGAWLPFGYTKAEETLMLVPDKQESKVVKQMFQWCVDGLGMRQITSLLNDQGTESRTGKPFTDVVVYQMLTNPLYKGFRRWKGELFNCVEPIVSEEIWQQAQAAMESRNNNKARNTKYLFLLSQKLFCGCCGDVHYHAKYHPRKTAYYMCYNRKFGKDNCLNAGISISGAESLVWHAVKNSYRQDMHEQMQELKDEHLNLNKQIEVLKLQVDVMEREQIKVKNKTDRALKLYVDGFLTYERMSEEVVKVQRSADNLVLKLESARQDLANKQEQLVHIKEANSYGKFIRKVGTDRLKMREVIEKLVDRVVINSIDQGVRCDQFILSVWLFGSRNPQTYLFNKKTFEALSSPCQIRYEGNVLVTDLSKAKMKKSQPVTIDQVMFTFVNLLNPA